MPDLYDPNRQRDILIKTLNGEAGSEPVAGQIAVASVLRNRLNSGQWGDNAAGVAQANDPKTGYHQFSMWNPPGKGGNKGADIDPKDPKYQQLGGIVDGVFGGTIADPTNGATHYFAPGGMPGGRPPVWAANGTNLSKVGSQYFMNLPGPADLVEARSRTPVAPSVPTNTTLNSMPPPPNTDNPFVIGYQPRQLPQGAMDPSIMARQQTTPTPNVDTGMLASAASIPADGMLTRRPDQYAMGM